METRFIAGDAGSPARNRQLYCQSEGNISLELYILILTYYQLTCDGAAKMLSPRGFVSLKLRAPRDDATMTPRQMQIRYQRSHVISLT